MKFLLQLDDIVCSKLILNFFTSLAVENTWMQLRWPII